MLLISIAPVITQSLASVHASGVSGPYVQTDYCGQPPDTLPQSSSSLPDGGSAAHEQCLYCSLLVHFPLLHGSNAASVPANPRLMDRVPARQSNGCSAAPTFPRALTRAPPMTSPFAYIHAWNVMPEVVVGHPAATATM
jgi:hypothetical protein